MKRPAPAQEQQLKDVLDAEAWVHICRVVDGIPSGLCVARCPDDASLIRELGGAGAYDSLLALQDALAIYFSDLIFAAVRASISKPMTSEPAAEHSEIDDAEWARMYAVPWDKPTCNCPSEELR